MGSGASRLSLNGVGAYGQMRARTLALTILAVGLTRSSAWRMHPEALASDVRAPLPERSSSRLRRAASGSWSRLWKRRQVRAWRDQVLHELAQIGGRLQEQRASIGEQSLAEVVGLRRCRALRTRPDPSAKQEGPAPQDGTGTERLQAIAAHPWATTSIVADAEQIERRHEEQLGEVVVRRAIEDTERMVANLPAPEVLGEGANITALVEEHLMALHTVRSYYLPLHERAAGEQVATLEAERLEHAVSELRRHFRGHLYGWPVLFAPLEGLAARGDQLGQLQRAIERARAMVALAERLGAAAQTAEAARAHLSDLVGRKVIGERVENALLESLSLLSPIASSGPQSHEHPAQPLAEAVDELLVLRREILDQLARERSLLREETARRMREELAALGDWRLFMLLMPRLANTRWRSDDSRTFPERRELLVALAEMTDCEIVALHDRHRRRSAGRSTLGQITEGALAAIDARIGALVGRGLNHGYEIWSWRPGEGFVVQPRRMSPTAEPAPAPPFPEFPRPVRERTTSIGREHGVVDHTAATRNQRRVRQAWTEHWRAIEWWWRRVIASADNVAAIAEAAAATQGLLRRCLNDEDPQVVAVVGEWESTVVRAMLDKRVRERTVRLAAQVADVTGGHANGSAEPASVRRLGQEVQRARVELDGMLSSRPLSPEHRNAIESAQRYLDDLQRTLDSVVDADSAS